MGEKVKVWMEIHLCPQTQCVAIPNVLSHFFGGGFGGERDLGPGSEELVFPSGVHFKITHEGWREEESRDLDVRPRREGRGKYWFIELQEIPQRPHVLDALS